MKRSIPLISESGSRVIQNMNYNKSVIDYSKYVIRSRDVCLGFIERFGKLNRKATDGLNFTIPFVESIRRVTLRELFCFNKPLRAY